MSFFSPTNVADNVFEKECMRAHWLQNKFEEGTACTFSKGNMFGLDFEFVFRKEGLRITRWRNETKPVTKRNVMIK